jgi:hypothetical protein
MKKAIPIILVVLVLISIYFVFFHKTSTIDENTFNINDTSKITQIAVSNSTNKVAISKISGQWMVNTKYHANQAMIKHILRIFKNIDVSITVPDNQKDSVVNFLKKKGMNLQFMQDNDILKEFWIGSYNETDKATLLMNEDEIAAFVTAPGLSNNISKLIDVDLVFWRDRQIFCINPEDIKSIELTDFRKPENSFLIETSGDRYQLFDKQNFEINFDKNKLLRYLSYFSNISFESPANELNTAQQDSVKKQKPVYSIRIENSTGQSIKLLLFAKKADNDKESQDLNFIYGNLNNEKLVLLISYFQIDPVLKSIEYFR